MEKLLDKIYKCNCDDFALSLELLKDCITEEQILDKYREVSELRDLKLSLEPRFMMNAFLNVFRGCALDNIMLLHGYTYKKNHLGFKPLNEEESE